MRIVYDSGKCMGCGLCASLDQDHFGYTNGKAVLVSGKEEASTGIYEIEATAGIESTDQAASVCPVLAINVIRG